MGPAPPSRGVGRFSQVTIRGAAERLRRRLWWMRTACLSGLCLACSAGVVERSAAEEASQEEPVTVRKTQARLNFQLPPDWPIERRGGAVGPIPMEEYLSRKFKTLEGRLQALEQRFNGLDLRLRVLEEASSPQRKGLVSSERSAAPKTLPAREPVQSPGNP